MSEQIKQKDKVGLMRIREEGRASKRRFYSSLFGIYFGLIVLSATQWYYTNKMEELELKRDALLADACARYPAKIEGYTYEITVNGQTFLCNPADWDVKSEKP